jgi:hypothetical protein
MNKKFFIAWVVIFIAWFAGSFVVHGVLLHDDYAKLPNLFRPEAEAQKYFPLLVLAHVILAGALVWIYSRGVENGAPVWPGDCVADDRADIHHLLRRAADAGRARSQADRVRWDSRADPRCDHGVLLSTANARMNGRAFIYVREPTSAAVGDPGRNRLS